MSEEPPVVFVSYSHDNEEHKAWVLQLATRLMNNGVNVTLDRWDIVLGGNLATFMEQGLTGARRVLAICTEDYVKKANSGLGGVGYEKTILTQELMQNSNSDRVIPVVINNELANKLPTFLSSRLYTSFADPADYEAKYLELLHELHGEPIQPRPALGPNPFKITLPLINPFVSFAPERYVSPARSGKAVFDYSNNSGSYVFGAGDMAFETKWSTAGKTAIHVYNEGRSIRTVAVAWGIHEINDIQDATQFDGSSRVRTPNVGNVAVWQNTAGYWLATKILRIDYRNAGDQQDEIEIEYFIAPAKLASFVA